MGHRCAEGEAMKEENIYLGGKCAGLFIYKPRGAGAGCLGNLKGSGLDEAAEAKQRRRRKPGIRHRGRKRGEQALLCAWEG